MNKLQIFKSELNYYIPCAFAFAKIKDKTIIGKIDSLENRYNELIKIENPDSTPYKPNSIFELLFLASNDKIENKRLKAFLLFIDKTVVSLIDKIQPKLHSKLRETVRQIILSLDEKLGTNYQYLNFLGEIFGLDYLISQDNSKIDLVDIERKLPNGRKVDFVFINKDDDALMYVDYVSLHNIDITKLQTSDAFISFFENRFEEKIFTKIKDIDCIDNFLIIDSLKIPFFIQPIIWSDDIRTFLPHKSTIKLIDTKHNNVLNFASLFVEIDKRGEFYFSFTSVSNILEQI